MAAYTGPERRLSERRSNWARAVETMKRDLMDDWLALEKKMQAIMGETHGTLGLPPADGKYLVEWTSHYWGRELAAIIRRHQEP